MSAISFALSRVRSIFLNSKKRDCSPAVETDPSVEKICGIVKKALHGLKKCYTDYHSDRKKNKGDLNDEDNFIRVIDSIEYRLYSVEEYWKNYRIKREEKKGDDIPEKSSCKWTKPSVYILRRARENSSTTNQVPDTVLRSGDPLNFERFHYR